MFFFQTTIPFVMTSSIPIIIVGGLLVGIGTKIGISILTNFLNIIKYET